MKICIISIFPEIFTNFVTTSLIGKACSAGLISIEHVNLRDFADPPHFHVDDTPYGGGAGMVLKPEPLARAITSVKKRYTKATTILFSASGTPFKQQHAQHLSSHEQLILVCGRYEGVDQRLIDSYIDHEISIGDYVLMGGEVAAMVVIEATTRLIPGVIGNPSSLENESYSEQTKGALLEGPQYTRPPLFEEMPVPEVLLSGDHKKIEQWRHQQAQARTQRIRPELCNHATKPKS